MIVLKNWYKTLRPLNDFRAPELGYSVLCGHVYGHPSFPDGSYIHSSRIVGIEDMGDHKEIITKSGSRYSVFPENVLPAAERDYPDYYQRLKMEG
ncbi:MAG TPA: hypothetical protein GXX75_23480 [Clostridiales bacterium]|nr:hypothetical protein [Clostridiales bacterium]